MVGSTCGRRLADQPPVDAPSAASTLFQAISVPARRTARSWSAIRDSLERAARPLAVPIGAPPQETR